MDPVTKLFSDEMKYESYVRALSDNFSVVDEVATAEDYARIHDKESGC